MKRIKQNIYNKRGIEMPNKNNRSIDDEKVALEFAAGDIERALKKIIKENHPFELVGQGIIVVSKDVAETFKKQNPFRCKEIEIVSLFHLPRKKANQIRKRHLQTAITSNHK
jgi:hypothetical protein